METPTAAHRQLNRFDHIPDGREDLDRYEVNHLFHSWSFQPSGAPRRVVSARGLRFTDEDDQEYLDFSSCFVSHNIGHQDPRVVDALCAQAHELCSFAPVFSQKPRAMLAKVLADVTPGDLSRSFLTLGGAESIETAVKIAHQYTGKRKILSRYPAYHGATATAMTLSSGDPRSWAQLPGGAERIPVPSPYCYRCQLGRTYPECGIQCAEYVDRVIEMEGGGEQVAAVVLEPVTGANGIIVPPDGYIQRIREICDKWGILMIADEIMTGFGRTGKWFAVDHWNVVPDILCLAKGITSGYLPLGATVVREHIGNYFKNHYFSHGATYMAHALSCATALRVIGIYQEDDLIDKSARLGEYLLEGARTLQERHPSVGDVRGLGLFVGLELVKNRKTREPLIPLNAKIQPGLNPKLQVARRLLELGMIVMSANPSNVIAMAPALTVTKSEIDEGLQKMDEALEAADQFVEA